MSAAWYYSSGGQQAGPVSFEDLQNLAATGTLTIHDMVWTEGMPAWMAAGTVASLFPTEATQAAPSAGVPAALSYYSTPASEQVVYAGFWLRVLALLIDTLVLVLIFAGVGFVLGLCLFSAFRGSRESMVAMQTIIRLVGLVVAWLYFAKAESGPKQATPGKSMLGLQVTDLHGQPISFGRATGRFFGKYISELTLGIGFIMAGFTSRKQALHDIMAGTLVLKTGKMKVV